MRQHAGQHELLARRGADGAPSLDLAVDQPGDRVLGQPLAEHADQIAVLGADAAGDLARPAAAIVELDRDLVADAVAQPAEIGLRRHDVPSTGR